MAKKDTKAATELAALQEKYKDAKAQFEALPEGASEAEKTELENTVLTLEKEIDAKETEVGKEAAKPVKVKFLKSPTGKYRLGYTVGDEAMVPANVAAEMIETEFSEKA